MKRFALVICFIPLLHGFSLVYFLFRMTNKQAFLAVLPIIVSMIVLTKLVPFIPGQLDNLAYYLWMTLCNLCCRKLSATPQG